MHPLVSNRLANLDFSRAIDAATPKTKSANCTRNGGQQSTAAVESEDSRGRKPSSEHSFDGKMGGGVPFPRVARWRGGLKMARQIVAVRMSGGAEHRHIAGVALIVTDNPDSFIAKTMKITAVLKAMDENNDFFVRDAGGSVADVVPVRSGDLRYIRAKKDGILTDTLLRLPRYKSD